MCWTLPVRLPRRSRGPALRRAVRLTAIATVAATLVAGCSGHAAPTAEVSYGAHIDTITPPGLRAKQTMDMLNSDWPIGPVSVGTLATPEKVDLVGTKMDSIWWDRPFRVTSVDIGAAQATLHVLNSYNVAQDIELRTDESGLVDRFDISLVPPTINTWSDIDTELTKSGARYSYRVSRVIDGNCEQVAGTNTELSLPLASIFKLYVLLAVSDAIKDGTLSWDDHLTITKEGKKLGSAGLDKLPPGALITVRTAAQQMISASDNMATDLLIERVGPTAVERALVTAGHHDPASMTPFPTMHQVFSVGWGEPNLRDEWRSASRADRVALLRQTNSRPYQPDPYRTHTPASDDGLEWFASAADICRVHAALQASAVGPAAPVKDILSALPGIDLDPARWGYIGAKGGNLPGDLTFSWYAVDHTGQPWVVSFQLNWPTFRSATAAGWLIQIAKRAFAMAPVK